MSSGAPSYSAWMWTGAFQVFVIDAAKQPPFCASKTSPVDGTVQKEQPTVPRLASALAHAATHAPAAQPMSEAHSSTTAPVHASSTACRSREHRRPSVAQASTPPSGKE